MHTAAWGNHPIAHYGRWLKDTTPSTSTASPASSRPHPAATPAPETKNNPIPRVVPHRLGGRPDRRLARSLAGDVPWFTWMSFPDPHHPWDPPASELRRVPWQDLDLPRAIPGSTSHRKILATKPAHWLGYCEGTFPDMEGGPAAFVPSRLTHDQIREVDAKVHVMNELIDEASGRVLPPSGPGVARRHRRHLHHRPRRDEGRLWPPLQRPVPHRRVDAAAVRVAAGAVAAVAPPVVGDPVGQVDLAPTFCAIAEISRRRGCRGGRCRGGQQARARARCASGTASSPATACTTFDLSDGWLCTVYEPSTAGQPNGLEETRGEAVLEPCRWSTSRPRRVRAGRHLHRRALQRRRRSVPVRKPVGRRRPACLPRRPRGGPLRHLPAEERHLKVVAPAYPPSNGGTAEPPPPPAGQDRFEEALRCLDIG